MEKKIMWILNLTPDSFFDWWKYNSIELAKKRIDEMIKDWADIIDIWGFSSKPWSTMPSVDEELSRIMPVIKYMDLLNIQISVDTCRSEVVKEIITFRNLRFINDISWLQDEKILDLIKNKDISYILMHIKWTPKNMQKNVFYTDIITEVYNFLEEKIKIIKSYWIKDIIIDPGFGFWKTIENNYEILNNLSIFKKLWFPILAWLSRKSMIYKLLETTPEKVLSETVALNLIALRNWADILRVHDVKVNKNLLKIYDYLK